MGAGFFVNETIAEILRGLKHHQGFLVGEDFLVAAVRRDKTIMA